MNNHQRYWYLDEMVTQSLAASISYSAMERRLGDPETRQTLLVWTNVSSFLGHAGIISKILYPPRQPGQDRAKELKEVLRLPALPYLEDRGGRDNIEHIDERIDNWAAKDGAGLVSMVFDNRAGFDYLCTPDKSIRRALIADDLIYISENRLGDRVETPLRSLLAEIEIVRDRALEGIQADPPYHFILASALQRHGR